MKYFILIIIFFNVNLLSAQEFNIPPKLDLFQHSVSTTNRPLNTFPDVRMWGWSRDGKVAYSIEKENEGIGGKIIDFFILNLINDRVIFNLEMIGYDDMSGLYIPVEALYNLHRITISNALRTHNIAGERNDFLRFPFRRNNIEYNSQITGIERRSSEFGFGNVVSRYTVLVTADNRRKVIANFNVVNSETFEVYLAGYFLSPFENRILVVIAEEHWVWGDGAITYRFSGCNLGVGFN